MKKFVIGFDGLSGVGKTSTAIYLCKNNNYIYLELGDLCRKIAPIYAKVKEKYDLSYVIEYISNLNIGYTICDNRISFKINDDEPNHFNKNINIRDEIYNMVQINKIKNYIYDFLANTIDKLKDKYTIILIGRELELIYPKLDYHFLFKANEEDIIKRIMIRDKISEKEARARKKLEESMHSFSKNVITCNTSRLNIDDVVKLVQNILNYKKMDNDIIKIQFLGTQSTGKTTISKYCSKLFNDSYISEKLREYMEENKLEYFDILSWTSDKWYNMICSQILYEQQMKDKSTNYIFVDSAAILYAFDFDLLKIPKIENLVNDQLYSADLIFICDNDIPYIEDGLRPSKAKTIKTQQKIIDYLNKKQLPYIILSGDINERIKTIEQIIKNKQI